MLKIGFVGHSFVRDLESIKDSEWKLENGRATECKYFFIPGSCYKNWVEFPQELHDLIDFKPDILVVYLGGNSIVATVSDADIKHYAKIFFDIIRNNLPKVILIASEIELRFVAPVNRFETPTVDEFKRRRNGFNFFLRKCKKINFLAQIGGPSRLDDIKLYKPGGIHLNEEGIRKLDRMLKNTIEYAVRHSQ